MMDNQMEQKMDHEMEPAIALWFLGSGLCQGYVRTIVGWQGCFFKYSLR